MALPLVLRALTPLVLLVLLAAPASARLAEPASDASLCGAPTGAPLSTTCGADGMPARVDAELPGVGGASVHVEEETSLGPYSFRKTGVAAGAGPVGVGASRVCTDDGDDGSCEHTRYNAQVARPAYVGASLTDDGSGRLYGCAHLAGIPACAGLP